MYKKFNRKFRPKNRRYKKRYTKKPLAVKAYSMVKKLYRTREKKVFNGTPISVSGSSPANTWSSGTPLIQIPVGDTADTREGNMIYLQSMLVRLDARLSGDLSNLPKMRIIIVQDLQQVADTTPAISDILYNSTVFDSPYNYPKITGRFKICYDKVINPSNVLFSGGYYAGYLGTQWYNHTINGAKYFALRCKNFIRTIRFNGTAATDIQKSGMFLYYCFDETVTNELTFKTQIKFTDA